jgi:hypothetical protein
MAFTTSKHRWTMTNLYKPSSLKNLGKTSDERLAQVGIETVDDLRHIGSVEAYRRVKSAFPRETTMTMLWALEGALLNGVLTYHSSLITHH